MKLRKDASWWMVSTRGNTIPRICVAASDLRCRTPTFSSENCATILRSANRRPPMRRSLPRRACPAWRALSRAIRGERMTIIISTHRLSLLSMVDRLLLFDSGRLVADGPRDKVLAILQGKPVAAPDQNPVQPKFAQTATVVQKPNAAV